MSQPTAGSMLAELLRAQAAGESPEQLQTRTSAIERQIAFQTEAAVVEVKFQKLGHKPENKSCDHSQYDFNKHGRYCTCGTVMVDFGD